MDKEKNGELLYSIIGGNIGSKFKIDSVTGVLSMDSLDREYISKYILTISVRDNGQHSRETFCNLTVIVLDENDNAPTFLYDAYTNITLQPFDIQSKSYEQDYNNQNFIQGKYSKTISENVDINSKEVTSIKQLG
ncbi:protein dachsous, partial [Copidosoma floridanum]|uniref:protein dachsous n=1 Tax=Copidosoma floridanum TaxID=29053 RepID=UPI0006C980AF